LEQLETLNRDQLIQIILDQYRMIERLQAEIEQLKRGSGAAPFSKGTHKTDPKPPGRKPGQGFFRFRNAPEETPQTEAMPVPVAGRCCPDCGGRLGEAKQEIVTTTDIPVQPQPEVRRYAVEVRECRQCGRRVRGQHPDIAPGQQGATAHRLGPRVKALAHTLHYLHGVPVRKTPAILEDLTGIRLTQGAITQDAMKQAEDAVGASYEALRASVKEQPVVHTDDTGWRVGGEPAFLMAFVTPQLSVFQIRPQHRNEEVRELIPANFGGVLVCDRGKSYDARELEAVAQQKCLSHLIINAAEAAKEKTGRARQFGQRLKDQFQCALSLWADRKSLQPEDYRKQAKALDEELTIHLKDRTLRDPDNQRLLNGVGTQHDRGNVLRFLCEEGVEPTNNRAERDLRPAVIVRKVSHCSKNERGARAFEAFTSLLQTLRKVNPSATVALLARLISRQPTPT
jgi:transposase